MCVVAPQESGCRKDFVPGHFYALDGPAKDENCEFDCGEIWRSREIDNVLLKGYNERR